MFECNQYWTDILEFRATEIGSIIGIVVSRRCHWLRMALINVEILMVTKLENVSDTA